MAFVTISSHLSLVEKTWPVFIICHFLSKLRMQMSHLLQRRRLNLGHIDYAMFPWQQLGENLALCSFHRNCSLQRQVPWREGKWKGSRGRCSSEPADERFWMRVVFHAGSGVWFFAWVYMEALWLRKATFREKSDIEHISCKFAAV